MKKKSGPEFIRESHETGEWANFQDVCLNKIGMQTQYASRYARGLDGYPNLGEGLRFQFDPHAHPRDIDNIKAIHKDDVEEFVRRIRAAKGLGK